MKVKKLVAILCFVALITAVCAAPVSAATSGKGLTNGSNGIETHSTLQGYYNRATASTSADKPPISTAPVLYSTIVTIYYFYRDIPGDNKSNTSYGNGSATVYPIGTNYTASYATSVHSVTSELYGNWSGTLTDYI